MRKFIPATMKLIPKEAKKVFQGEIYAVYQWPQELYDGSMATFEMLRRPDTVKIIAVLTPEEQKCCNFYNTLDQPGIVITKQKQPTREWFYDYPGGRVDDEDRDELAAAQRELREETGLVMQNWRLVTVHQPFNKIDWLVYTFVATGLIEQKEQTLDAGEKIELQMASIPTIQKLAEADDSKYLRLKDAWKLTSVEQLSDLPSLYQY